MKVFYDFHIHSALSPCADDDNSPNNIVNMAALCGLNAIAVSDHNSVRNCRAAMAAGERAGVLVVPAMELTTSEDIHILCLFSDISGAEEFEKYIRSGMMKVKNNPRIFGNQYIYGENDNIIGEEEYLLSVATAVPSYTVCGEILPYGGVALPAHIHREANGILPILGSFDGLGFTAFETTSPLTQKDRLFTEHYKYIIDSDAHSLENITDAVNFLELPKLTAGEIVKFLSK